MLQHLHLAFQNNLKILLVNIIFLDMTNSTAQVHIGVNWVLEFTTKEQNVESTFATELNPISKEIFDTNLMIAYKLALTQ